MKATIDRIEGKMAVLIPLDDETARINFPVSLLPPDCREGDILMVEIERDIPGTKKAKERVSDRIERLRNRK